KSSPVQGVPSSQLFDAYREEFTGRFGEHSCVVARVSAAWRQSDCWSGWLVICLPDGGRRRSFLVRDLSVCHLGGMDERPVPGGRRYSRPYVLPDRLESLSGPTAGTVHLPRHLDWSGHAVYDLDVPGRLIDLYRTVIIEASGPQDLERFLDA